MPQLDIFFAQSDRSNDILSDIWGLAMEWHYMLLYRQEKFFIFRVLF